MIKLFVRKPTLTASFLITIGSFLLYLSMLPTQLSGRDFSGDSGDFLSAILVGGIPHPTGYPTYTLLGMLFQRLPIGTPYTRGALLSAIPAALAVGLLVCWLSWKVVGDPSAGWIGGAVAGIAAGIAAGLWSQAVIVEVYGLEAFFILLALWWIALLVRPEQARHRPISLVLLALAFGIGLGNHVTLVLMAPLILVGFWIARKRGLSWGWLVGQVVAGAAGLLVYLYLPLAARGYPPINWGNPQTWQGFSWVVGARPYQGMVFGLQLSLLPERIAAWARLLWNQFGLVGMLVGVLGAIQFPIRQKLLQWSILWVFGIFSAFAIGYRTDDSLAYLIPAYLVFAGWIGLGILVLLPLRWRALPVGWGVVALVVITLLVRIPGTYRTVDPRADTRPAEFAAQAMADAPNRAILLANGDADAFPLWYAHFGLKQRPDIAVVVLPLTQFAWYQETLMRTYQDLMLPPLDPGAAGTTRWGDQIPGLNPDRAVCRSTAGTIKDEPLKLWCAG